MSESFFAAPSVDPRVDPDANVSHACVAMRSPVQRRACSAEQDYPTGDAENHAGVRARSGCARRAWRKALPTCRPSTRHTTGRGHYAGASAQSGATPFVGTARHVAVASPPVRSVRGNSKSHGRSTSLDRPCAVLHGPARRTGSEMLESEKSLWRCGPSRDEGATQDGQLSPVRGGVCIGRRRSERGFLMEASRWLRMR